MAASTSILITLVLYKIGLVVIGVAANRRTRDAADFFLGGRKLGAWVAALSASASSSSAWTLLGVSGAAYHWGLPAIWIFPACVGGFAVNWYVLAPRLRRLSHQRGVLTVTELIAGPRDGRLSTAIAASASVIVLVSLLGYVAAQFQGSGKTFNEVFGMSLEGSIVLGAAIVMLYTLLGGFWAVSVTDTLQGLLMAAAAVVLPVGAVVAVGGPAELVQSMHEVPIAGFTELAPDLPGPAAFGFVLGLLGIGLGYPGQPHVVNRYMAMKDEQAVQKGRRIAMTWAVSTYAGMLVLGWCARVLYPELPDPEVAFVTTTRYVFPPVVAGIMIAAVLSAIMSTVDSQLLVAASAVTHDLRLARSHGSELAQSRWVVLVLTVGAIGAALIGSPEIFSRVLFAWTAMGAAFGPLLLVTVWRGRVAPLPTLLAMWAGFALSVLAYSFEETRNGAIERCVPFVVALVIAWLGAAPRRRAGVDAR